jgi:hypothetical protein
MTAGTATRQRASVPTDVRGLARRLPRSPVFYGVAAAVVAALAGQWGHVSPPSAYGLCSACHGRDLADWILNHTEGTKLFVTAAGASWPLLTVVGVVAGSWLAARRNGEYSAINIGANARQFAYGAVVMCAALFVGGCPTRIIIRAGFGDVAGVLALGGVAAGIVMATLSMRWAARR